ncbi:LysE family translocator [Quadrisphaera sp. DSM 44207]|uniref:LysE family translocator n=1 Tax=Quadrisphaera sp. DSM 44207 TaxID=1881057 RepID=UPI000882375F|nr:LysE family transporter [Quadrisphaera sp. DSM 44207]SDQ19235.1 Threonine/homoserine/homoserine lactone efflux protein [Quadrisphaera sp. DSM 44207]
MSLAAAAPLLAAWILAVVSPGPDFLVVLRTASTRSRAAGLLAGLGVVTGIACWAVAALVGISALLERHEDLYTALRLLGAVVLIGFGVTTLAGAWRGPTGTPGEAGAGAAGSPGEGSVVDRRSGLDAWRIGLVTNLANPKALVFFGALFASLLPVGTSPGRRAVILVAMLTIASTWFSAVALAASTPPAVRAYQRARRGIDAVTGGLFTAFGAALVPR